MLRVDAVGNRLLLGFPSPLWARSLRPQGRQRPRAQYFVPHGWNLVTILTSGGDEPANRVWCGTC
jgi:hypothetical protein